MKYVELPSIITDCKKHTWKSIYPCSLCTQEKIDIKLDTIAKMIALIEKCSGRDGFEEANQIIEAWRKANE